MTIDIWSDIRCPFCYIGKRKFETGLSRFAHKEDVSINWHSFELDPSLQTDTSLSVYDYLAERKGFSRNQSLQMHEHVQQVAREAGLRFDFEHAVIANSFDAHRLIQLATSRGLGNEAEERLFRAYFTEGKNIDDRDVLTQLGLEIGLQQEEVSGMLLSDAFTAEVRADEARASQIGINGVPFFVINNQYGVSGAQSPDTFLQVLEQTWQESRTAAFQPVAASGEEACEDGACNS